MARQEIDLTTPQPNGKMGEPTKSAWEKVNDMTLELYSSVNSSVSVTDSRFGADPTGNSDSSAAIQAAINFVLSLPNGGTVIIPSGNYKVSNTINAPKQAGKRLDILGMSARLVKDSSMTASMMYFGSTDQNVSSPGMSISGITFVGEFPGNASSSPLLAMEWASGSVIKDCSFRGGRDGVRITNCYATSFVRCSFVSQSRYGLVSSTDCMNLLVDDCLFNSITTGDLVFQVRAHSVAIRDTDFEGGAAAISFIAGCNSVVIDGCYIESKSGIPIYFGASSTSVDFRNTWLGYNSGAQQWVNVSQLNIYNNIFWDQQQSFGSGCFDVTIGNNTYAGTANQIYSPWTAPVFENGYTNVGGQWSPAGYYKDARDFVQLRGVIQASSNAVAFTLPVGYRPTTAKVFATLGIDGTFARFTIFNSGQVSITRSSGGSICLDGCSFQVGS